MPAATLNEGQTKYDKLTDEQYDELYNKFYKMFSELENAGQTCSNDEQCS